MPIPEEWIEPGTEDWHIVRNNIITLHQRLVEVVRAVERDVHPGVAADLWPIAADLADIADHAHAMTV